MAVFSFDYFNLIYRTLRSFCVRYIFVQQCTLKFELIIWSFSLCSKRGVHYFVIRGRKLFSRYKLWNNTTY